MAIIFKIPYNFFSITSLNVYSELLTAFQNKRLTGRVSRWMGDAKICDLLSGTYITESSSLCHEYNKLPFWEIFVRPGQRLATFQSNILQHCCMILRPMICLERAGQTHATFSPFSTQHVDVYVPQLQARNKVGLARMPWSNNVA